MSSLVKRAILMRLLPLLCLAKAACCFCCFSSALLSFLVLAGTACWAEPESELVEPEPEPEAVAVRTGAEDLQGGKGLTFLIICIGG